LVALYGIREKRVEPPGNEGEPEAAQAVADTRTKKGQVLFNEVAFERREAIEPSASERRGLSGHTTIHDPYFVSIDTFVG
ncbi:MAG TPA: hypothetical protein VM580_26490, partial [Labilithrix sp.]|nr:hypothetical protein [Labilithrix sp.]